jgi:hypothetical protein
MGKKDFLFLFFLLLLLLYNKKLFMMLILEDPLIHLFLFSFWIFYIFFFRYSAILHLGCEALIS